MYNMNNICQFCNIFEMKKERAREKTYKRNSNRFLKHNMNMSQVIHRISGQQNMTTDITAIRNR